MLSRDDGDLDLYRIKDLSREDGSGLTSQQHCGHCAQLLDFSFFISKMPRNGKDVTETDVTSP